MSVLEDARQALAASVAQAGMSCLPYPPDNPSPPIAFVDDLVIDFTGTGMAAGSFCKPGLASATIVSTALANDRTGSTRYLEGMVDSVLTEFNKVPGVRVIAASSGQITLGGQEIPTVTYTVQFFI